MVGRRLESERNSKHGKETRLPNRFEERIMGSRRGMIIHGWAPQLLILEHEVVGGFMTHRGWKSNLEGMISGLPIDRIKIRLIITLFLVC